MIERDMTEDDFIRMMAENEQIYKEYNSLPLDVRRYIARVNMMTGPAKLILKDDGTPFMCLGMRFVGIGEMWGISSPQVREKSTKTFFRTSKYWFNKLRDELNLWRVYANNSISSNYLEHLGFEESKNEFIWTRI